MHILIAEDNDVNVKLLTRVLARSNCATTITWNGKEALEYLANPRNPRPDMFLLDIAMPVMGGLEVLENIRTKRPFIEDPILQNIPVVLMTATHMTGDLQRYLNRGANDIFAKPVRINRIRQLLLRWSRREVVPLPYGQLPGPGVKMRPVWGPMPLRGYRGPKSLL